MNEYIPFDTIEFKINDKSVFITGKYIVSGNIKINEENQFIFVISNFKFPSEIDVDEFIIVMKEIETFCSKTYTMFYSDIDDYLSNLSNSTNNNIN
jgi:hypothetical protein